MALLSSILAWLLMCIFAYGIIFCLLFVLTAIFFSSLLLILLYAVPLFRKSKMKRIASLKSVPLGCLSVALIPIIGLFLIWGISCLTDNINGLVLVSFLFICFIGSICFGLYITKTVYRKIIGVIETFPIVITSVCHLIFIFLITCVILAAFISYRLSNWSEHPLPTQSDVKIVFKTKQSHPFLSEFEYMLILQKENFLKEQILFPNTGGAIHLNVYKLEDERFLFDDSRFDYIVDIKKGTTWIIKKDDKDSKLYVGDISNLKSWKGVGFCKKKSGEWYITIEGVEKSPLTPLDSTILSEKKFYGFIDCSGFHFAEEK